MSYFVEACCIFKTSWQIIVPLQDKFPTMKHQQMRKVKSIIFALLLPAAFLFSCNGTSNRETDKEESYSVLMGETIMKDYPRLWMIENPDRIRWTYTHGLVASAMLDLWKYTDEQKYFDYVEFFADSVITDQGEIRTYQMEDYNIDKINSGKMLIRLYEATGKDKYRIAIETLREQLEDHPQTDIGGYWHKKRYPHQMWLDGLYMGGPFLAQYAAEYGDPETFDFVVRWFTNMEKVARDPDSGLLYHGWDESREQKWSDPVTGTSSNFWGRGMGWYGMALVDVLDFIPSDHPGRDSIVPIARRMAEAILKVQDEQTGLWYQVLDQGDREGNYIEGSVSSMFSYFLLKGVNKGYLEKETYEEAAATAYQGIIEHLMTKRENGTIVISPVCAVAGLGGDPYRDGSYEYYINERTRDNDPKATGPFIMAGIQYEKLNQ